MGAQLPSYECFGKMVEQKNGGSLNENDPWRLIGGGTIKRYSFVGVGVALLEIS